MTKWPLTILLLATNALAQFVDPCTGAKVEGPATIVPIKLPMTCAKEQGRDVGYGVDGLAGWRFCLDPESKRYSAQVGAVTWLELAANPGMAKDFALAWHNNAGDAEIGALMTKYATTLVPFTDPKHTAVWCPFRAQIAAAAPPPPAAPVWVTTSTVLYRLNEAGTGLGAQVGTAKRGEFVDGTQARVISRMTFCPWVAGPSPFKTYIRCAELKVAP